MIGIDAFSQAVGCAAEMVTLAVWGVGRTSLAAGAGDDNPDVFRRAAALARGQRASSIGLLLGSSSVRECHVPKDSDPSVWVALSGGHWRVIVNDSRIVELPPCHPAPVPPLCFPAVQFDGLPRSKTRSSCASITLFIVEHKHKKPEPPTPDTSLLPLPVPSSSCAPIPLSRIIGHRNAASNDGSETRQLHVIWEKGHAAESAMHDLSAAGHDVDKWYAKKSPMARCRCEA
jgi:hypothetical protein